MEHLLSAWMRVDDRLGWLAAWAVIGAALSHSDALDGGTTTRAGLSLAAIYGKAVLMLTAFPTGPSVVLKGGATVGDSLAKDFLHTGM
jgi:hypothetical protein